MYVYLLKSRFLPQFKIGKTRNIHQRISTLGVDNFILEYSLCLKLNSENKAFQVEKMLHRLFEQWNITPQGGREGDTEYFDIQCFPRVINFLNENIDIIGATLQLIPQKRKNKRLSGETLINKRKEGKLKRFNEKEKQFELQLYRVNKLLSKLPDCSFFVIDENPDEFSANQPRINFTSTNDLKDELNQLKIHGNLIIPKLGDSDQCLKLIESWSKIQDEYEIKFNEKVLTDNYFKETLNLIYKISHL